MKARPILFSAPMVRALLEGRKTQTRRIVKAKMSRDQLDEHLFNCSGKSRKDWMIACPHGNPGDLLWVRETTTYWERPDQPKDWSTPRADESHRPADGARYQRWMERVMPKEGELPNEDFIVYKADDSKRSLGEWKHPHPIYEHCVGRFGKTVTAIHMHRSASRLTLRITDVRVQRLQEISEEDAVAEGCRRRSLTGLFTPIDDYAKLWESIHGHLSFDANPWVWAVSFEVIKANVDDLLRARAAA